MNTRIIRTSLVGKEELFRILAVSEALKLPVLFIGEPGVAKTQALVDYAASMYGHKPEVAREKCFLLELDEGSQTSEVKGRVNMKKYIEDKTFSLDTPITNAEFIMINEVDKGSSSIRNTMLSIMRERALFLGNEVRHCKWHVFAGSCNSIPADELDSPFWDRFVIKYNVERLKKEMIPVIWDSAKTDFKIEIPEEKEIRQEIDNLPVDSMLHFLDIVYKQLTDRTLSQITRLVCAIRLVYRVSFTEAIVKACEFVAKDKVTKVAGKIEPKKITSLKTKIVQITGISDQDFLKSIMEDVFNEVAHLAKGVDNKSSDYDMDDVHSLMSLFRSASSTSSETKELFNQIGKKVKFDGKKIKFEILT